MRTPEERESGKSEKKDNVSAGQRGEKSRLCDIVGVDVPGTQIVIIVRLIFVTTITTAGCVNIWQSVNFSNWNAKQLLYT